MKTLFVLIGLSCWIAILFNREIGTGLALGFTLLLGIGSIFCEEDAGLFSDDDK